MCCFSCKCLEFDVEPPNQFEVQEKRKCTNCLCCGIFLIFWIFFIGIFIYAVIDGDEQKLFYPSDYLGNTCGKKSIVNTTCTEENPCEYIYYPRLNDDVMLFATKYAKGAMNDSFLPDIDDISLFGVCVPECPHLGQIVCTYDRQSKGIPLPKEMEKCTLTGKYSIQVCKECWIVPLNTTSVLNRCMYETGTKVVVNEVCINPVSVGEPGDVTYIAADDARCVAKQKVTTDIEAGLANSNPLVTQMSNVMFYVGGWLADLNKTKYAIICTGVLVPFVLGFLFVLLMKYLVGFFVVLVVVGVFTVSIAFTVFCLYKGGVIDVYGAAASALNITSGWFNQTDMANITEFQMSLPPSLQPSANSKMYWEIGGYVMIFLDFIIVILFVALYRQIRISIAIVKAASNALYRIPSTVLLPVVIDIVLLCFTLFFIFSAAMMYTAGDTLYNATESITEHLGETMKYFCPEDSGTLLEDDDGCSLPMIPQKFNKSTLSFVLLWFDLFGFLWNQQFLTALLMTSVAGAVGTYYYTKADTKGGRPQKAFSPFKFLWIALRYHSGSLALGSFIVAIIQWLRAILMYIDKQTKRLQDGNCIMKCAFKICHCCCCCLECCMKFISRNAYILIATRGYGFFKACSVSFKLIFNSLALVGTLSGFSGVLIFLGKVTISGTCACIAYGWFSVTDEYQFGGKNELNNPFIPTIVCLFISYMVATSFLGVYHMIIDTILLCYCEDTNAHHGGSEYTPGPILDVIGEAKKRKGVSDDTAMKDVPKEAPKEVPQELPREPVAAS